MSTVDTCNVLVGQALSVFSGSGGINDQLAALGLSATVPEIGSILAVSASADAYEKTTSVRYPMAAVYCDRLRNTQQEKFRMLSGIASLVLEIRTTGARAEDLDRALNSYVEAACRVLDASRGPWTSIGTYSGQYDVKFQPARAGGKQFLKTARIEFEIQVSN